MSIIIRTSPPTSSYFNREITSSSSLKKEYTTVVIRPSSSNSTSSTSSNPNLFARLPSVLTRYIFSFDHDTQLHLCNRALCSEFTYPLRKFASQLLGIEAKEVEMMTLSQLRKGINAVALRQLKTMRTLFTRCELQTETGIVNPDTFPLLLNPLLPLYHLTAYTVQWEKLVSMSNERQTKYSAFNYSKAEFCLWPNVLNLKLSKKEVSFSELSNVTEQHNQIAAAWEIAAPSLIRSLFRDNIDRLHHPHTNHYLPEAEACQILSKFLQKPEAVKLLLPKDLEYALLHILTNELTFDNERRYQFRNTNEEWDFREAVNALFVNLIKTNSNLKSFKLHLQLILKIKASEFKQLDFTVPLDKHKHLTVRCNAFGQYLRDFKEIISTNLRDFTFPAEFTAWAANPKKWRSPESTSKPKCIVQ